MERMSKKPTKEPVTNPEYGLLNTEPSKERINERKVSGRRKKSGDANARELGETTGDFFHEQGEIREIASPDGNSESPTKEQVEVEIVNGILEVKVVPSTKTE